MVRTDALSNFPMKYQCESRIHYLEKKKRLPTVAQRASEIEHFAAKCIYLQINFTIKSTRKWIMERSTTDRTDESQFHGTENHSIGSHLLFDIPSPTWR